MLNCRKAPLVGLGILLGLTGSPALAGDPLGAGQWNPNGGEQEEILNLTPNPKRGREVYKICAPCHLPEGWGPRDGTFPQIAGQHYKVIIKQLADIRAWNRSNPVMYPFAQPERLGGPQAVADVAAYIEGLRMNPKPNVGPGTDLEHGAKIYQDRCASCHGRDGEGNGDKFYPRIQGQHYSYLTRQFEAIKDRKRRNAKPEMIEQIEGMNMRDQQAVLDYLSRLRPDPERAGPPNWQNPDFEE